jgi:glycogen debranching enzyme
MLHAMKSQTLASEQEEFLALGYEKALETVRYNITPTGFTACSLDYNDFHGTEQNYRSVWGRDGAMTVLWTLDIEDEDIRAAQLATLQTLLDHQARNGQIPASVSIDTGRPEYAGVGGISAIDSVLWLIISVYRFAEAAGHWDLINDHRQHLKRAMHWLEAHDSNNCGLLEIPEAGDWTDLFARSYHVLYDEVLWQRALVYYARIMRHFGESEAAERYDDLSDHVRRQILSYFWPTTKYEQENGVSPSFTQAQYSLGDARYFIAQISPFSFSWRCDVYANILAYLTDMIDYNHAMMSFRFMWGVGVNEPSPVKNLYPPVQSGDPEWRDYFLVNMLNLPNHYHNGGIWPFIGGMWVRYVHKLGMVAFAQNELLKLARLCYDGSGHEWEFNEWHHGQTGRAMGKRYQAWSAASFIRACHDMHLAPESVPEHI